MHPPSRPAWLILPLALLLIILLVVAYLGTLAATVDVSRLSETNTANDRDLVYLGVHAGFFVLAIVIGFVFGKWANGLGVAFAALLFVVLGVSMLFVQLGSYALACEVEDGENGIIRHWEC